jgi:hypothetical protein
MTLTIKVKMDNAAFEDDATEAERIVAELASSGCLQYMEKSDGGNLRDINGNIVGEWRVQ